MVTKYLIVFTVCLCTGPILCGCGVSQKKYSRLKHQYEQLRQENGRIKEENEKLSVMYQQAKMRLQLYQSGPTPIAPEQNREKK